MHISINNKNTIFESCLELNRNKRTNCINPEHYMQSKIKVHWRQTTENIEFRFRYLICTYWLYLYFKFSSISIVLTSILIKRLFLLFLLLLLLLFCSILYRYFYYCALGLGLIKPVLFAVCSKELHERWYAAASHYSFWFSRYIFSVTWQRSFFSFLLLLLLWHSSNTFRP